MNDRTLYYPEKQTDEITSLDYAISGHWKPEKIEVNENLLADELCVLMEEEIQHWKDNDQEIDDYDIIYDVDKEPFRFTVDVNFDKYHIGYGVAPGDRIRVNGINIEASWGKNSEGFSKSLPVKWDKEILKSCIEMQIRLPLI